MFPAVRALVVVSSAVLAATVTTSVVLGVDRDVDVDTPAIAPDRTPLITTARRSTAWSEILGRQPVADARADGERRSTAAVDRDIATTAMVPTVSLISESTLVSEAPTDGEVDRPVATSPTATSPTATGGTPATLTTGAPSPTTMSPPVSDTTVPAASVSATTTSATATTTSTTATSSTTAATTTTVAPSPAPFTETYQSAGGSITVSWDGSALHLVAVQPADRHEAQVQEATATKVQVRFRGHPDSRITVRIADGAVKVDIKGR